MTAEIEARSRVVVIGEELSKQLFQYEDPIGKTIIVNNQPMTVIGVTRRGILPIGCVDLNQGLLIPFPLAMENHFLENSPSLRETELTTLGLDLPNQSVICLGG